jgi:hypothetical protein
MWYVLENNYDRQRIWGPLPRIPEGTNCAEWWAHPFESEEEAGEFAARRGAWAEACVRENESRVYADALI